MSSSIIFKETADDFLKVCHQFKLGSLVTESPNPLTVTLSDCCASEDLITTKGLPTLKKVDLAAFGNLIPDHLTRGTQEDQEVDPIPRGQELKGLYREATEETFDQLCSRIQTMSAQIHKALTEGRNVIFVCCGATGRLSLSLEVFAHLGVVDKEHAHQVLGIHTGGDSALLRSIPEFEDKIEYGIRQLYDTGFRDGDLVIAITEGGETPFVIAVCEEAARVSTDVKPWFLYCNPDPILASLVERSARVINNPNIEKLNLYVGPMAITGSTRMQATTVQQLIAGLALAHHADPTLIKSDLIEFATFMRGLDYGLMGKITYAEAQLYKNGEYFLYEPEDSLACTVMTDSTERSPTFSLPVFENFDHPEQVPSTVYLHLRGSPTTSKAWLRLMRRPIRGLNWDGTQLLTGNKTVLGYDFSDEIIKKRAKHVGDPNKTNHRVRFELREDSSFGPLLQNCLNITVGLDENPELFASVKIPFPTKWRLEPVTNKDGVERYVETLSKGALVKVNIFVKMLLNAHSTAIMGYLKRYEQNVMTYVAPSNYKLIDRAVRYVILLLTGALKAGTPMPDYEQIVRKIYEIRNSVKPGHSIVLLVRDHFLN